MKEIPLSKTGKHKGKYFAKVDDEDYEYLMQWNWCVHIANKIYARRAVVGGAGKNKLLQMHRQILGLSDPDTFGDHIDGNGLNNQRSNLRPASKSQNAANRKAWGASSYLGVTPLKRNGKWRSQIRICGETKALGVFDTEVEAAKAYDKVAIYAHGEFAKLNFPNH